ncbi:MAG: hypothetical protein MSK40_12925 [Parabacteroides sp.]|nr:hypothetical protein [Parabacteroides sp.]MCI7509312.1 hypothetical protein [Prevotella sp.]
MDLVFIQETSRKIIEKNKVELLKEQTNKIEEVLTVLRTQFCEEFEDEENYLSIVVDNLKNK